MAIDMTCKICKFERAYLTGQVCISCQQERKELFQKVALRLLPNADIPFSNKDIMQKARGFTEKLISAADKFAQEAKTHE